MTVSDLESIVLKLIERVISLEIEVKRLHREFEAFGRNFGGGESISVDEGLESGEHV